MCQLCVVKLLNQHAQLGNVVFARVRQIMLPSSISCCIVINNWKAALVNTSRNPSKRFSVKRHQTSTAHQFYMYSIILLVN